MVQELINRSYHITNDKGEAFYENITNAVYQNFQTNSPVYENADALK